VLGEVIFVFEAFEDQSFLSSLLSSQKFCKIFLLTQQSDLCLLINEHSVKLLIIDVSCNLIIIDIMIVIQQFVHLNLEGERDMSFFKQKSLWMGSIAVFVALMIFGLAMMGSVLSAKPKSLPVALVVLDQPVDLPTGEKLALGEMVKLNITGLEQLPIKWIDLDSESAAQEKLDSQKIYGALVIPANFSSGILSIQSSTPMPSTVKLIVNEGMNTQAVTAVKAMLNQLMDGISGELSDLLIKQIGQQAEQIPVQTAKALFTPFHVEEAAVHSAGANNGNGTAPNLLTQISWIGCLVLSIFLYFAAQHAGRTTTRRIGPFTLQLLVGILLTAVISGFIVWMANSWYGMHMDDPSQVWLFLWLVAAAFFILQSALLNWIGIPAMGLLVLLLFFSLPILNLAPEFMPQATQDWLYSWTPFRYASSGLRTIMYYGGEEGMSLPILVMWWIAGVGAIVLLASSVRKGKVEQKQASLLNYRN